MQKITPFLWFDKNAEEAATLYTSLVEHSSIGAISRYGSEGFDVHHMPEGTVMTVNFTMGGMAFVGLNGGAEFKPNPSISFHIKCTTPKEVDTIWEKLSPGGTVLMELGAYPFSKKYGWIQDRYGVSWQIIYTDDRPFTQQITPVFMFTKHNAGYAEEAMNLYVSVFQNSKVISISRYGKGMEPDAENSVTYASFTLENIEFGAMDSAQRHDFTFTEAISLAVSCKDQAEVDYFWNALIRDDGEEGPCGWLKDKYGVSWQITPTRLGELLSDPNPKKAASAMRAMLSMKKIDIQAIEKASSG